MEKFSQFRDRGSGIAPFLPIPSQPAGLQLPLRCFLFFLRLPLFIFVCLSYFLCLQWLPIGSLGKKASLWCILGIPSIWWIDIQVDGVKKGSLSKQQRTRLPGPGSVIASSFTSPIDAVYLAAVFDPIFTACYPNTRHVEQISLLQAILRSFMPPQVAPSPGSRMVDISTLLAKYPGRPIAIFPECTTTNSRGVLPLSLSLLGMSPKTKVFPVSLRYTPADVVTPLPKTYLSFLWALLSSPTHGIRVRIAESICATENPVSESSYLGCLVRNENFDDASTTQAEKEMLDQVGESLARLGRVKRVGLGVKEKEEFVRIWTKTRQTW